MMKLFVIVTLLGALAQLSFQQTEPALPAEVTAFSASRDERHHHLYFHTSRMNFHYLNAAQQIAVTNLGWKPPHPAKAWTANNTEVIIAENGEDFLFMHRRMIADVNRIAQEAGSAWRVLGWENCPAPGDRRYPVPAGYTIPGQEGARGFFDMVKGDDYYWDTIEPAEEALKDEDYLRSITLGELGSKLEFEIHTWMHIRFSAENTVGYRAQPNDNPFMDIDESWDVLGYDYLADFYSAHVNPHFWKIHGWIESKIESWRLANDIDRIEWIGTWEGGPMSVIPDLYAIASIIEEPETTTEPSTGTETDTTPEPEPIQPTNVIELSENTMEKLLKVVLDLANKTD